MCGWKRASRHPRQKAWDRTAQRQWEREAAWFIVLDDSSLSSVSICPVAPTVPLVRSSLLSQHFPPLAQCFLADWRMKGSWCQSLLWGSGCCQHHSVVLLGCVEEGLGALKAQCSTQSLLLPYDFPLLLSPVPASTPPRYFPFVTLLLRVLSLNQDEDLLCH